MTSQQSIGEYHRLSLLDEAVVQYHSVGEDFIKLLDLYINVQDGQEKYTFIGPDYLLLGHVAEDDDGRYWHVSYAAHRKPEKTIHLFLELAPFQLDRVRFCRYHNMNTDKYYSWKSLKRISNYGLKSTSASSSTAATTSAGSSSNSGC
jgi:hypothetical protein